MVQSAILVQRSWLSELRALKAGAKKEWLIFRRYPSWIVSTLVWPVLFPFLYIFTARALSGPTGAALPLFAERAGTTDYFSFIMIGTTLWMWLNMTLWDLGFQLRSEQMRGTLESNWLCPVPRISIMLSASFTKLATSLFFLAVTMIEFRLVYGVQLVRGNVALLLLIMLLVIPSIYGIGLAFGSLVIRFKEANAMVFLVRGIFMIFCGITYPLEVLPEWMQSVAGWLPLTHAIQGIREVVLAGATAAEILPTLQRLVLFAVVLPLLGYVTFQFTERTARRSGSLGQY